jgi:Flp pilus assembly protein TadD
MLNHQYDAAEAQFKQAAGLDPSFQVLNMRMAQFHALQENFEQAKAEFDKASSYVGKVVWKPGRDGFYQSLLEAGKQVQLPPEDCIAAAALGDNKRAMDSLEYMAAIDPPDAAVYVRRPEFDALHAEPRFLALLKRMNLQP